MGEKKSEGHGFGVKYCYTTGAVLRNVGLQYTGAQYIDVVPKATREKSTNKTQN